MKPSVYIYSIIKQKQSKTNNMKTTAIQQVKVFISDNRKFINGNIAEHMILEMDSSDNNFYWYLTDEEIEEMDGDVQKTHVLEQEVKEMLISNFDYDISEFEFLSEDRLFLEKKEDEITSFYVLSNYDFTEDQAFEFLRNELSDDEFEKVESIQEDESVASAYNYKHCLIFHDTL